MTNKTYEYAGITLYSPKELKIYRFIANEEHGATGFEIARALHYTGSQVRSAVSAMVRRGLLTNGENTTEAGRVANVNTGGAIYRVRVRPDAA